MAAGGTPGNVKVGPGRLWFAPLGTTEPTTASGALPSAWIPLGYTESGHTIATNITNEGIDVAEEVDDIASYITKREITIAFNIAEATKRNLILALGGGAGGTNDNTPFDYTAPADIVPVMLVHDTQESAGVNNARIIIRSAMPSGTITEQMSKAPQKRLFTATFKCSKSAAGLAPISRIATATGVL